MYTPKTRKCWCWIFSKEKNCGTIPWKQTRKMHSSCGLADKCYQSWVDWEGLSQPEVRLLVTTDGIFPWSPSWPILNIKHVERHKDRLRIWDYLRKRTWFKNHLDDIWQIEGTLKRFWRHSANWLVSTTSVPGARSYVRIIPINMSALSVQLCCLCNRQFQYLSVPRKT